MDCSSIAAVFPCEMRRDRASGGLVKKNRLTTPLKTIKRMSKYGTLHNSASATTTTTLKKNAVTRLRRCNWRKRKRGRRRALTRNDTVDVTFPTTLLRAFNLSASPRWKREQEGYTRIVSLFSGFCRYLHTEKMLISDTKFTSKSQQ